MRIADAVCRQPIQGDSPIRPTIGSERLRSCPDSRPSMSNSSALAVSHPWGKVMGTRGATSNSRAGGCCPASSILSGQRQLEFPILFERYQQQSGLWEKWESRGLCGISKGGGKGGKPAFGFPRFPPPAFFHSPRSPHFYCGNKHNGQLASPDSKPASRFFLACSMR